MDFAQNVFRSKIYVTFVSNINQCQQFRTSMYCIYPRDRDKKKERDKKERI